MELILCMIVGIIIGIVFGRQVFRRDVVGSLRIDQSDPDSGPYLFLELSHKGADAIYKKRICSLESQHQRLYFARITSPFMEQLMNSRKEN